GYADCDSSPTDGCEVHVAGNLSNCNGCGQTCAPAHAAGVCSDQGCGIASCNAGYGDCNKDPADGCERDLRSDVNNCQTCGHACQLTNGTPSCNNGACEGTCNAPWQDCTTTPGCETNTSNDVNHCGNCSTVCSTNHATPSCQNSKCVLSCAV